jgi:hypothetical protein
MVYAGLNRYSIGSNFANVTQPAAQASSSLSSKEFGTIYGPAIELDRESPMIDRAALKTVLNDRVSVVSDMAKKEKVGYWTHVPGRGKATRALEVMRDKLKLIIAKVDAGVPYSTQEVRDLEKIDSNNNPIGEKPLARSQRKVIALGADQIQIARSEITTYERGVRARETATAAPATPSTAKPSIVIDSAKDLRTEKAPLINIELYGGLLIIVIFALGLAWIMGKLIDRKSPGQLRSEDVEFAENSEGLVAPSSSRQIRETTSFTPDPQESVTTEPEIGFRELTGSDEQDIYKRNAHQMIPRNSPGTPALKDGAPSVSFHPRRERGK